MRVRPPTSTVLASRDLQCGVALNPTVGRIVHYKLRTGEVRPALVVNVLDSGRVSLRVFLDPERDGADDLWCSSVTQSWSSEDIEVGCWQWPPRES